ncbi:MAG: hypothetical protein GQ477_04360, partial [Nanohaloarchaea archaeon]|nr:hypothetical protein [Candidatus Nanohaloarchaea archaeon]
EPDFITDSDRVQFITRIKIHPEFKEAKLGVRAGVQAGVQAELIETDKNILKYLKTSIVSKKEISNFLGYKSITRNVRESLKRLLKYNLIELTIPNKPKHPNQKYKITKKGLNQLKFN